MPGTIHSIHQGGMMQYAVAFGEMFDSISFAGPFDDIDAAELWATPRVHLNWWIVRLEQP
jgi:hypothetical protein